MNKRKFPQYNGDPFPLTEEEIEQMAGSNAHKRRWAKFNRGVKNELERAKQRQKRKVKR